MEKLFFYIVRYSYLLLPIAAVIYFILKGKNKPLLTIIGVYGLIIFIMLNLYDFIVSYSLTKPIYAQIYQSVFTFIEFSVFSMLIYKILAHKNFKKLILISMGLFLIFQVAFIFTAQIQKLDSVPIGVETILIFVFIMLFFYERFQDITAEPLFAHPGFWLSLGMLLYLGASLFFYLLINYLDPQQRGMYGFITYIADITKNLLFVLALFVSLSNERSAKAREPKHTGPIPFLDMI